ncbi:MAG: hypothetical protein JSS83_23280 [Cyanobacteria bacterium SZAS LIN-3]|nr:hypothetical protein [Cyanobacteria bacterium SZAS LIN-3]
MAKGFQNESLEKEAGQRLYALLSRVSFLHVHKPQPPTNDIVQIDGVILVEIGIKKYWLLLEVKNNAQIRDARNSIQRLRKFEAAMGAPTYPIFISQYLSQSIRDFCQENEVGYFDFSGNCLLEFDQVFIEREMPDAVERERKRYKSLFSPKSSRVIRRLLQHPDRPWKVQHLALEAGVSAATVSLVKDKLLGDGYAAWRGEAFIVTQPDRLLEQWSKQYQIQDHIRLECYAEGSVEEIEERFAAYCKQYSIDYAFTSFSAAKRVANFTRGVQRGYAYVADGMSAAKIASALELKTVESGGNFIIMVPADQDIFFDSHEVNGESVVSDIQLYLDLTGHPGRGQENAEYLLETRIRRQW